MTIAILSYDRPTVTRRALTAIQSCLSSLTPSERPPVVLLHNGSQFSTVETLKTEFPEVQHEVLTDNRGYAGGANHLLSHAFLKTPWVLFLSNDCELMNLPSLPERPTLVGPLVFRRKVGHVDSVGARFNPTTASLQHCRRPEQFRRSLFWETYIPGSAFLIHQDVFNATRGFDETLFAYWEDVDLSLRVRRSGYALQIQPDWKLLHGVGKTCHGKSLYSVFYFQRNRRVVSLRYTPQVLRPMTRFWVNRSLFKLKKKLILQGRHEDAGFIDKIFDPAANPQ